MSEGGTDVKSKKKKVDSGKSIHVEEDFPIPPVLGPFESLASELKIVKDIVTKLPQGSGESSSGPVSYVPQSEFDAYFKDQRKQKARLANLEKAYADLAKSHGELSISHSKMKKWEKSREKFFTRMWKGVKGLWKVLKANESLPISRPEEDGHEPAAWSDDGGAEDSEGIDTDGDD
ncbi:hypothetical protein KY290_033830 [Solanum tuberosum]|uniref:Uncharacterized protein n=1 Tax=Solanum tuberosum TaxID=4113 RepID=A0ABQ7U1H1_SOLTU|nr:hypothetical protein KY289_033208 [Solanum tuberosum]KAH0647841.1 hypothetical protein KY285_033089 [Solanum tuberosum]KAH0740787.1 hypothetical protein KY290_033830 [Solanum tuberosum]